jgi:hypothetical protein
MELWEVTYSMTNTVLTGCFCRAYCLLHADFFLDLLFCSEDGSDKFLLIIASLFGGKHSAISQKTEHFITTVVRTSNPTKILSCVWWDS